MRRSFAVLTASAVLVVGATATFAQPVAPIPFQPAVPPPAGIASPPGWRGDDAIATLERLLRDRGFGEDVAFGPMDAFAPGDDGPRAAVGTGDVRLDAPIGARQPEAWFVYTAAGGWWVWDYGAAAPADRLAEIQDQMVQRQARARGATTTD